MKLYRILNNTLIEEFPNWIEKDGIVYTNSYAEELAINNGWYPLVISPLPQFDSTIEHLIKNYHLVGNEIHLDWNIQEFINNTDI